MPSREAGRLLPAPKNTVALTIDDGPHPTWSRRHAAHQRGTRTPPPRTQPVLDPDGRGTVPSRHLPEDYRTAQWPCLKTVSGVVARHVSAGGWLVRHLNARPLTAPPLVGRVGTSSVECCPQAAARSGCARFTGWHSGRGRGMSCNWQWAIHGPLPPVNSGHRGPTLTDASPWSNLLSDRDDLVPKLMTSRSLVATARRVLRDQVRDNRARRGQHTTDVHGPRHGAHQHVPARPATASVASGRRGHCRIAL